MTLEDFISFYNQDSKDTLLLLSWADWHEDREELGQADFLRWTVKEKHSPGIYGKDVDLCSKSTNATEQCICRWQSFIEGRQDYLSREDISLLDRNLTTSVESDYPSEKFIYIARYSSPYFALIALKAVYLRLVKVGG